MSLVRSQRASRSSNWVRTWQSEISSTFNREKRRDQAIIPDELPNWWREVDAHDNPIRRDLQKFILLTGMRRTAAVTARWEDLDKDRGLLFVPDPKGGEERAFWLPLSDYLVDLLDARRSENEVACPGSPWLWPADSAAGPVTEPKEYKRELPSPHMLRHSYATFAKAAGLNELDIGLLMNHKLPGVTAGYIHEMSLLEHLKACQERVTTYILSLACVSSDPISKCTDDRKNAEA